MKMYRYFSKINRYDVYATYLGSHILGGAIGSTGCGIKYAIDENDMSYCVMIPFYAIAGGIFGGAAGLIPGVTTIVGFGLLYKKLNKN